MSDMSIFPRWSVAFAEWLGLVDKTDMSSHEHTAELRERKHYDPAVITADT